jgi:hypothetical protein
MTSGNKRLKTLRSRIQTLLNAQRSHMCWELGHFQTPMFVKEPGKLPSKPYMLVCIDTASRAIMGSDLLLDLPHPEDFLFLLVASMEAPCVGTRTPILPESVYLDDSAAFRLLGSELGQLGVRCELVEDLPALRSSRRLRSASCSPARSGIRAERTEDTDLVSSAASKVAWSVGAERLQIERQRFFACSQSLACREIVGADSWTTF